MIVPMQKVTLFISARHQDGALKELRKLGVVHVQHVKAPVSEDISQLEMALSDVEKCLLILNKDGQSVTDINSAGVNTKEIVSEVLALSVEKQQMAGQIDEKESLADWFEAWGKVSVADIEALQEKGIFIRLYNIEKNLLKALPEGSFAEIIYEEKNQARIALISESAEARLDVKEDFLPQKDYNTATKDLATLMARSEDIELRLKELTEAINTILAYKENLEKRLEFARVKSGMQDVDEIVYLQGYCPEEKAANLLKASENESWGILSEEPGATDNPPTLVKPSWWARIIQPVFSFLGTVPGYREYDISQYFLVFFALFVAMIIGDAGYGVIFLLISIFAHYKSVKSGQSLPLAIKLFYVLSLTTIAWGTITGNWFGSVQIAALPFFKALTMPQLATFKELFPDLDINPQQNVMFICFVIAIVHLGLAHILNFVKHFPKLKCIANLGWFSLIFGLFFLVLNLVLGMEMPVFAVPTAGAGLIMVVFFMNQEKGTNFFKGVVLGLGGAFNTFLNAISSFSNIISYIRLFAVGLASVAIATSFNGIAAPMMKGAGIPAAILILIIGHGLNIVMGLLSVIVHGIRLNVLEFSGQLGMEWAGYEYKPFKENDKSITEREIQ
ncbi:MAG: hypothetical protein V1715_08410 [bacterium]